MFCKQELKIFLEEISEGAKFLKFIFYSDEKFVIEMRSRVEDNKAPEFYSKYLSKWMEKFSNFTSTPWIVGQSFPNKRTLYRQSYLCARASRNKKSTATPGTRSQDCQAKIDFKFNITNRNTLKDDPILEDKLNLFIHIDFVHSHKVKCREALKSLKSPSSTDDIFYEFIENGYSPTMAKAYHELILIDKHGEKSDRLKNPTINPTMSHVMDLFNKSKEDHIEALSFEQIMEAKKEKMEEIGGTIYYPSQDTIVVITPTMKRVMSSVKTNEVVITSAVLSESIIATLLFAPSQIGALCFACVLHKEQTEIAYSQAFFAVKLILGQDSKAFEPKNVVVDDINEIKLALKAIYPKSKVMISPWSLCTQTWQWICDDENKIDKRRRHELMAALHTIVHADDVDIARGLCGKLKENAYVSMTPNVTDYVSTVWQSHRLLWKPDEDRNILGLSLKALNEFLITKCKCFNLPAMVDVVMNIMDSHFRQILRSCNNNEKIRNNYTKFLEKSGSVCSRDRLKNTKTNEYKLENKDENSKWSIKFRTDTLCCDCKAGMKGHFCPHLCAIINTDPDFKIPIMKRKEISNFMIIAGEPIKKRKKNSIKGDEIDDIELLKSDDEMHDLSCDEDTSSFDEADEEVSSKDMVDDDCYYLEVTSKNTDENHPSKKITEHEGDEGDTCSTPQAKNSFKNKYDTALKAVNDEFKRLDEYFKRNANASNLSTMARLARELAKIRPMERVSFKDMVIELNSELGINEE